ncbi:UNVERIFIED_CONTAM: hypothetical protein FKN15_046995 [Acipenser sinensis]
MPSPRFSDDECDDYEDEDVEKEVLSEPEGHIYHSLAKEDENQIEPVYAKPNKKVTIFEAIDAQLFQLLWEQSALAAAILASTLTGRTVAIPQPRQRSLSETDISYSENRSSVEPYASTAEIESRQVPFDQFCVCRERWNEAVNGRLRMPSPRFCDDEDDDYEDVEKEVLSEPEGHIYNTIAKEDESQIEPVYAKPYKKAEISKVEETAQRPSPTPDLTDDAYKELLEMNKEILQEMKERNHALGSENQALVQKLQEQGHRLQKTQLRLDQSQQENRRLKEADESLSREDHQAELHSIRQQAQELVDENDAMKMTIHCLNVELSRYQTQFRPLSKEEEEMKSFSSRVKAVVRENKELHLQLDKTGAVSNKEWRQLRDQARLVLEENQVLMEQLEVQQAKAKDSHNQHLHEVSKLTKQLVLLEAEKETQQEQLVECSKQLEELRSKYKHTKVNLENKVELDEHVSTVNELKRQLQQEEQKRHAEVEDLMGRIASLQTEKKTLLLEKTNLMADNKSIETELEISRHANRKSQRKIGLLKQQLEEALDKEVAAHQYLANLISLAEKATQERDQLIYMGERATLYKHNSTLLRLALKPLQSKAIQDKRSQKGASKKLGLAKDPSCPNRQCRITEAHLKKGYAAATEAVRLSNVASLLTVYQAALLRDLPECPSAALRTELGTVAQLLVKLAQLNARAQGRSIASLVVARRQLWLSQARVQEPDKVPLLDAPISPGHTFGPAVEEMLQRSVKAREASQQLAKMWPSKPFQPRRPQERQWRRAPPQQQAQSRGSMTAPSGVSARGQPAFVRPQRGGWRPRGGGKPRPRGSGQAPRERAQPKQP